MALPKKKVKIVKKPAAKKEAAAVKTKKVIAKKASAKPAAKKVVVKKGIKKAKPLVAKFKAKANAVPKGNKAAGKGKYPYEAYRTKKNVGNAAKNAILQGKNTDNVLEYVMEAHPECNISKASVGYYRTALRKEGYDY